MVGWWGVSWLRGEGRHHERGFPPVPLPHSSLPLPSCTTPTSYPFMAAPRPDPPNRGQIAASPKSPPCGYLADTLRVPCGFLASTSRVPRGYLAGTSRARADDRYDNGQVMLLPGRTTNAGWVGGWCVEHTERWMDVTGGGWWCTVRMARHLRLTLDIAQPPCVGGARDFSTTVAYTSRHKRD